MNINVLELLIILIHNVLHQTLTNNAKMGRFFCYFDAFRGITDQQTSQVSFEILQLGGKSASRNYMFSCSPEFFIARTMNLFDCSIVLCSATSQQPTKGQTGPNRGDKLDMFDILNGPYDRK